MLTKKHLDAILDGPVQYVDYANQPVDTDDNAIIEDITNPRSQGCPRFQSGVSLGLLYDVSFVL